MAHFPALPRSFSFAKEEEKVLQLWDDIEAFSRSIEQRKNSSAKAYTFYDGPPFATGLPHYGHMVASSIKDTVARYWTMRGHFVERRFGWDTHGLPIEMETEKSLNLSGPQAIRDYGIDKFNEACRSGVLRYTKEWRRVIRRLGRWVDFDNDYKTMDRSFMESVWWVFGQLWQKGLVYQGFRVMPYSVRLSTPLSNFEANLNYQRVQDPALTIKASLIDEPDTSLLIWTTTPWTLPSNLAIAVGKNIDYVKVELDSHNYIVAKDLLAKVFLKHEPKLISQFKGQELIGKSYQPIYDVNYPNITKEQLANCFKVIDSAHVTTDSGTGLVHMAPSYGLDDFEACKKHGMPLFDPLDEEGKFGHEIKELSGLLFKDANKKITKHLKDEGKLFDHSTIEHSYPFCWRSNTPLIYKAVPVWFVDVPKIKERMSEHNKNIHWVPDAVGHKRFANWLKDAADWSISRNRFWGTPIPIWQCNDCEYKHCISSASELESLSGSKVEDLHSHYIDQLNISCSKCSGNMSRVSEVFDCWFESGSMPIAQIHYPFENKESFLDSFPADFIAEGLDQTRGWFYTLLVISTALFDKPPFKNVVVNGMVLAADGSKMSKSKKNYPDPEEVIAQYGSDAVRAYLIGSPVVRGEPLQFNEQGVKEVVRSVMLPLFNCWSFFVQYANIDSFNPHDIKNAPAVKDRPEIDRFIMSKLQTLIKEFNQEMDGYYLYKTIAPTLAFIEDLTNWYIRRSRRRFWKNASDDLEATDKLSAYATLYEVLVTFSKILAPILPFVSESIYQNLVVSTGMNAKEHNSVHLCDFPVADVSKIDKELELKTQIVRSVVTMGRALREKHRINTRQPLKAITVVASDEIAIDAITHHQELITSELNVREVILLDQDDTLCQTKAKPNYKSLGPKLGKDMSKVAKEIALLNKEAIKTFEKTGELTLGGYHLNGDDVTIVREAAADMVVMSMNNLTVALDTELTEDLKDEGLMRESLSQLQRLRKDKNFLVTHRIELKLYTESPELLRALLAHKAYLASELLADKLMIKSMEGEEYEDELLVKDLKLGVIVSNMSFV